jgi:hypothetical protein
LYGYLSFLSIGTALTCPTGDTLEIAGAGPVQINSGQLKVFRIGIVHSGLDKKIVVHVSEISVTAVLILVVQGPTFFAVGSR